MSDRWLARAWRRMEPQPTVVAALALTTSLTLFTVGCQPGAAPVSGPEPNPSITLAGSESTPRPGGTADVESPRPTRPASTATGAATATATATGGDCHRIAGHDVCGPIYGRYIRLGGPAGSLGRPVDDATAAGGGTAQRFEHGVLAASPATGTQLVPEPAAEAWEDSGAATGPLGYPLFDPRPAVGAETVSYFQGGAVFVTGSDADIHETDGGEEPEIDVPSTYGLPLADFVVLWRARAASPTGSELVWTTDGCSGPTPPEVDTRFADACLRHDFGYRNFLKGPRVDPSEQRRLAVDNQFLTDLRATCAATGEPEVNWAGARMPCQRAAQVMYEAVRAFG